MKSPATTPSGATLGPRSIRTICDDTRAQILRLTGGLELLRRAPPEYMGGLCDPGHEMAANATLAYRHLEDARMRLGKVLQVLDGGTSCYDKGGGPPDES